MNRNPHAILKNQRPCVIWLTGLPGSGKSTIANLLEQHLQAAGKHTCLLDGDDIRRGLSKDLGFSIADRAENIRRVAQTARLMTDAGLIVIVSLVSPFQAERQAARTLFELGEFIEVFVNAPLAVCEQRDPKGLYRKARNGEIKNFTGLDSPYEPPAKPELILLTAETTPDQAAQQVLDYLM